MNKSLLLLSTPLSSFSDLEIHQEEREYLPGVCLHLLNPLSAEGAQARALGPRGGDAPDTLWALIVQTRFLAAQMWNARLHPTAAMAVSSALLAVGCPGCKYGAEDRGDEDVWGQNLPSARTLCSSSVSLGVTLAENPPTTCPRGRS